MDLVAGNVAGTGPNSAARSLTKLAFERLRADILAGSLRPNTRLRIHGLSDRYHIGTTAIREALSRLVMDGFVSCEDQRGFFVTPVSREELDDLTTTRVEVECLVVSQAFARGDVEWESAIVSGFHRLSRTPRSLSHESQAVWAQAHRQFHRALLSGCRSPELLRICDELYDKSERYRNLAERYTTPDIRDTVAEHRELMDASLARDAATVKRSLADHYWSTTRIILRCGFHSQP